ncbi:hypothetical protein Tco_0721216 [Tanacetum coccineum]
MLATIDLEAAKGVVCRLQFTVEGLEIVTYIVTSHFAESLMFAWSLECKLSIMVPRLLSRSGLDSVSYSSEW